MLRTQYEDTGRGGIGKPVSICPSILENLYEEGLLLADEARASFDREDGYGSDAQAASVARAILSCEALRTTTQLMHALAWLLNQRAMLLGEISESQLHRQGRLPPPQPQSDQEQVALLPSDIAGLVDRTVRFYARVERLDRAWRKRFETQPAVNHLREQLGYTFTR